MPSRGPYNPSICAACGVDPDEAAVIERVMRVDRPTLDALPRRSFDALARSSQAVLAVLRADYPEVAEFYEKEARP